MSHDCEPTVNGGHTCQGPVDKAREDLIAVARERDAVGGTVRQARAAGLIPDAASLTALPKKFDAGKARMDLIPPCVTRLMAEVLEFGAQKYGANNWAVGDGLAWSRLYGALQRHLTTWWEGREVVDSETGKSHLAHALCQLAFLAASEVYDIGADDRFKWTRD